MPPRDWFRIAGISFAAMGSCMYVGCGLGFAPGWANGWPGGLTIYTVWSTGISILLFVILVSGMTAIGATAGGICSKQGIGLRHGRSFFVAWLVISTALALAASFRAFQSVYASTLAMWPRGYGL